MTHERNTHGYRKQISQSMCVSMCKINCLPRDDNAASAELLARIFG